ncbi:MAG: hypothetical protein Q8R48_06700, partial [Candidatus Omnitrophota bacterium]|nr:hypothetical protein [Candidatus Omnitrophota bacterium]
MKVINKVARITMCTLLSLYLGFGTWVPASFADEMQDLKDEISMLKERLASLEGRLEKAEAVTTAGVSKEET